MWMEIVDFQLHDLGPTLSWARDEPSIRDRVLTEVVNTSMECAGIDAAVLHPVESLDWALARADEAPDRFCVVPMFTRSGGFAQLDPTAPDVQAKIAALAENPHVKAIRIMVSMVPGEAEVLRAGGHDRAFAICQRLRLPVFLFISGQCELVQSVASRYPDLRIIVDHLGVPQRPFEAVESPPWKSLDGVLRLAALDNVHIKLCGAPSLSSAPFPYSDVWPFIRRILDAFGCDRVAWGSDIGPFRGRIGHDFRIPQAEGPYTGKHNYAESTRFIQDSPDASRDEKIAVLGRTARRVLDWLPEDI